MIFDAGVSFEVFEVEDEFLGEFEFGSVVRDQAFDYGHCSLELNQAGQRYAYDKVVFAAFSDEVIVSEFRLHLLRLYTPCVSHYDNTLRSQIDPYVVLGLAVLVQYGKILLNCMLLEVYYDLFRLFLQEFEVPVSFGVV